MADDAPQTADPDRAAALAEAYKRGLLPPAMKSAYEEAMSRGLVANPSGRLGKFKALQDAPETSKSQPRWDVLGDIGRAAEGAASATKQDLISAFPGPKVPESASNNTFTRMGSALKVPLDAIGAIASPLTGAAHGLAGSAISYFTHALPIPGHDPKADADAIVDKAMLGFGPEGMEGGASGISAASKATDIGASQNTLASLKNRAVDKINAKMSADGLTAQEVLDAQSKANASGDKLTLMDLGKKNLKGLAGSVYRAPGKAGADIEDFLDKRDQKVTEALTSDVHGGIAKGSTFDAMKNLFFARTSASKPAFDEAFAADSMAPFESQYRKELIKATGAKGQIAKQISDIEKESSGALASRGAAGSETRAKYMDLHQQLEQAENDRLSAQNVFQKAKADGTANVPGAVWSPRLQEFMDNPEIQSGLKSALKLEKQDAVSERRPFKDSDYGIVGTDDKGDPILGAVPTMKSLAVAKEGLDARIADLKDPTTGRPTKAGLSLKKFRDEYVKELYRLNPKYKVAVDAWSGPSQSVDAIKEGKTHFSRPESNEEVKSDFDGLTPSDKEFYRLGAAESKIDAVERSADASDKTKRVINSERDRKRFRMLFDSDQGADKFIESVERKRKMFDTRTDIKGNSKTAQRQADDENEMLSTGVHAAHGLAHAASGNWLGVLSKAFAVKRDLGLRNDPEFNAELAKILTDPNLGVVPAPTSGLALISKAPLPGVQNQLAKGIFRAAHVNGLRALTMPQALSQPPTQGQ